MKAVAQLINNMSERIGKLINSCMRNFYRIKLSIKRKSNTTTKFKRKVSITRVTEDRDKTKRRERYVQDRGEERIKRRGPLCLKGQKEWNSLPPAHTCDGYLNKNCYFYY